MTLPYRLGLLAVIIAMAALSGFFYGRKLEQKAALESAVEALQKRERINNEVSHLNSFDLCIALGGLPDQCTVFLPRLDETAESK